MPVADPNLARIRQRFEASGVSVTDWAQAHGFRRDDVYAVLNGRSRCRRGKGHLIAVALGLKRPVALDSLVPWISPDVPEAAARGVDGVMEPRSPPP